MLPDPLALVVNPGIWNTSSGILNCSNLTQKYTRSPLLYYRVLTSSSTVKSAPNPCPFPRRKIYHVPHTETTLKLAFGEPLHLDDVTGFLLGARDKVQSEIEAHGSHGIIQPGQDRSQKYHYILVGDLSLDISNIAGYFIDWGMLGDVVSGLLQLLVEQLRPREVVFEFKSGDSKYRGSGSLVKG